MWIFGIIIPKSLYTIFFNLLISFQPLPVYFFFKQSLRFFTWELIALSTKINSMVLCALKQKTSFDAATIMFYVTALKVEDGTVVAPDHSLTVPKRIEWWVTVFSLSIPPALGGFATSQSYIVFSCSSS